MKPRWAPGFESQCTTADYVFHWTGGTTLREVERAMLDASTYKIAEAQRTGYMRFDSALEDRGVLVIGPYQFQPLGMGVSRSNIYNWDEFLWELMTIKRLGK